MNSMAKKRREGEANSPRGQRPARASQVGPSWSEFVRLAHQAVVAFAGTDMINRAEPRACGYSREPIGLDSEPDPKGTQARRQTWPETATEGRRATRLGLQPYWGKPAVRDETRGWGNRQHDLMAICHDARKSRNIGSHWSKPGAPPPYSTGAFPSPNSTENSDEPRARGGAGKAKSKKQKAEISQSRADPPSLYELRGDGASVFRCFGVSVSRWAILFELRRTGAGGR